MTTASNSRIIFSFKDYYYLVDGIYKGVVGVAESPVMRAPSYETNAADNKLSADNTTAHSITKQNPPLVEFIARISITERNVNEITGGSTKILTAELSDGHCGETAASNSFSNSKSPWKFVSLPPVGLFPSTQRKRLNKRCAFTSF